MGFVYRFVTSEAILKNAREKRITERRIQGYRGPVGAMKLDMRDTIKAFLDYFDELGEEGWIYCGIVEYPDLPYGGVYCFRQELITKIRKAKIRKPEQDEIVDEYEYPQEEEREELVIDMVSDKTKEELLNADSRVVNEVMFRRQKVIDDEDPDKNSDIIDELEKSEEFEETKEETPKEIIRHQLYKTYESKNPGKHAVFNGKETKQFKDWLDEERSTYDPYYKEYTEETGLSPIHREQETLEFKDWLKKKRE